MSLLRPEIESMAPYVPGFQPLGDEYLKLNTNEHPDPPSPRVLEALRRAVDSRLRLYPDPLATTVRERAAHLYGVEPEQVIVGNGSDELLTMAVRAVVGPGQIIASPSPSYTLYETLAAIQGARMRWVPFPPDFSLPEDLARVGARLVFLSNPNSPTGTAVPPGEVARLADSLHQAVLVIDEAYADFAEGNCLELARTRPNCIVLRSLSKSYGLAGVRVGIAIGPRELIQGLLKVKDSYNVNRLSQVAAAAALEDQSDLARRTARVKRERQRLSKALSDLGLEVLPSQANFVFVRFTRPSAREVHRALFQRRILVRHFDRPGLEDGLRITVGSPEQNNLLIEALADILRR